MHDSTYFRRQAETNDRLAARAATAEEREALLQIAEGWRALAATAAEFEAASSKRSRAADETADALAVVRPETHV